MGLRQRIYARRSTYLGHKQWIYIRKKFRVHERAGTLILRAAAGRRMHVLGVRARCRSGTEAVIWDLQREREGISLASVRRRTSASLCDFDGLLGCGSIVWMFPLLVTTEVPGIDECLVADSARIRTLGFREVIAAVFRAVSLNVERSRASSHAALVELFDARVALAR